MKVEDESKKIKIVDYMRDKVGQVFEATITGFSNKRVFFETSENIECSWDVVESKDDYYEFDEQEYEMVGANTDKRFKLGDKLNILIVKADLSNLQIEATPAE